MKKIFLLLLILLFIFRINNTGLASTKKPYIAIMYLENINIDKTFSTITTEQIRNELFQTDQYIILERNRLFEILREQGFQQSGFCSDSECAVKAGKLAGVEQMVFGSVGKIKNVYHLSLRIVDVSSGKIIKTAGEICQCSEADLLTKKIKAVVNKLVGGIHNKDNLNPDGSDLETKFLKANGLVLNKKFLQAKQLYNEIIKEGKGTIWENRAKNGLLTISNATQALEIASMNVVKGTVWKLTRCLTMQIMQSERLPEIDSKSSAQEYFRKHCYYDNNNFWDKHINNVYLKNSDKYYQYKLIFVLTNGQTVEADNNGIHISN